MSNDIPLRVPGSPGALQSPEWQSMVRSIKPIPNVDEKPQRPAQEPRPSVQRRRPPVRRDPDPEATEEHLATVRAGSLEIRILQQGPRQIRLSLSGPTTKNAPFRIGIWADELDELLAALTSARSKLVTGGTK
jgi:hypothetical protein